MDRRNFLKLVGCALLAPMGMLSPKNMLHTSEIASLPNPKKTLDEFVRYLVLQKQKAFTAYLMDMDGLCHSTQIIGVGLIGGGEMYMESVNPRNFWKGKPLVTNKIGIK